MPTLSHLGFKDSSLALQSAVDAYPAAGTKQSRAHPALRPIEGKEFTIAERGAISHPCPAETRAIALYSVLPDGRRHVIALAFVIAASGDMALAFQAMKAGAMDFIELPVGRKKQLASLARAVTQTQYPAPLPAPRETEAIRVARLTTRQRQVLDLVLAGYPSKNIAADLGISQRTVDNHRAAIMRKTGSKSIPALVRSALVAT